MPMRSATDQFEYAVLAEQQVFRFDVPVNDVVRVDEVECLEELEENLLDIQCLQSLRVFLQLLQDGFLYVLEHEVELAILPEHFQ
jgi:hypothetical protein